MFYRYRLRPSKLIKALAALMVTIELLLTDFRSVVRVRLCLQCNQTHKQQSQDELYIHQIL